jgi:hypothetical protein
MNQGTNYSAYNKKDINSIFKNKPKPISYVKGDIAYIAEISEESLIKTNRWKGNTSTSGNDFSDDKKFDNNGSKKGLSEDKIHMERQLKIGNHRIIYGIQYRN